jgi:tetratricopeptide (TPR) repeat protein
MNMELNDQELELLERYHYGTLPDDELAALERRLDTDIEFAEEAQLFLSGLEVLEYGAIETHRIKLDAQAPPTVQMPWIRRWSWAVAAVLVGVIGGVWWMSGDKAEQLPPLPHYAEHYPRGGYVMSQKSINIKVRDKAFALYELGYYDKAITVFEELILAHPDNQEFKLYASVCYLALNRYKDADNTLATIDTIQLGQHYAAYPWFRAIAAGGLSDTTAQLHWLNQCKNSSIRGIKFKADSILNHIK